MLRPVAKKNLLFTEVFLELELKEGVGGLQVQKTLFHSSTGAGAGSSGWAWSGPVPHHPLLSLSVQGIKPTNHIFCSLEILRRYSQTIFLRGPSLIVLRWNSFYILLFKKRIFRRRDGDKMIIISDMQQMKSPLLGSLLSAKKILINDIRSQNLANLRRKFMKFSETDLIFPGWRFAPHYWIKQTFSSQICLQWNRPLSRR